MLIGKPIELTDQRSRIGHQKWPKRFLRPKNLRRQCVNFLGLEQIYVYLCIIFKSCPLLWKGCILRNIWNECSTHFMQTPCCRWKDG